MLRVRVGIPHYFREEAVGPNSGYGSGRTGNQLARSIAFARSLGSFLSLNRSMHDWILNISQREMELSPPTCLDGLQDVCVEVHVFVCGDSFIQDVVELYSSQIHLHHVELEKPVDLPLAVVRYLLDAADPADLTLYTEDDLVIQDALYLEKLVWFHKLTNQQYILMPHRREPTVARAPQNLYVDGPINFRGASTPLHSNSEPVVFCERFNSGAEIQFVEASNPHSGMFCLTEMQLKQIRDAQWPPATFVSPLETAATGVVLPHFPILKTSWSSRKFFEVEHGNRSFLGYLGALPEKIIES